MKVNDGRENADYYRKMAWKFNELNRRYKQALEFYADYENHVQYRDSFTDSGLSDSKIRLDSGEMARQALKGESE